MALNNGKWWWGYIDDRGVITIKPYTNDHDIFKVEQLPFCKGIFDPFFSNSKSEAYQAIADFLDEQQGKENRENS